MFTPLQQRQGGHYEFKANTVNMVTSGPDKLHKKHCVKNKTRRRGGRKGVTTTIQLYITAIHESREQRNGIHRLNF